MFWLFVIILKALFISFKISTFSIFVFRLRSHSV